MQSQRLHIDENHDSGIFDITQLGQRKGIADDVLSVFQYLQSRSTKELSKRPEGDLWHHIKIPGLGEEAFRHQGMNMWMPFSSIVAEGLDPGRRRESPAFCQGVIRRLSIKSAWFPLDGLLGSGREMNVCFPGAVL